MFRKVILLIVVITMVSLIGITSATANESFLEKTKGAGIKPDGTPLRVGITSSELYSEFSIVLAEYTSWLLKNSGCIVDYANPDLDLNKQVNILEDFVAMGKEVIIVQPVDDFALLDASMRVQEKGIPVLAMNHPMMTKDQEPVVDLLGGSPNWAMGEEAAKFLVEKANGKKVKIVQFMGAAGQLIVIQRDKSFRSIIEKHPNIELVDSKYTDWKTEEAYSIMVDMLTVTPDIWGIYLQGDVLLPGILEALEQAGRLYPVGHEKHIITASVDGAPVALDKIREGVHDFTVEQNPYAMSCVVAKGALMIAQGLDLPKGEDRIVEVRPISITAENVEEPSLWGNYGVPRDELWPRTQEVFDYYKWPGDEKIYE